MLMIRNYDIANRIGPGGGVACQFDAQSKRETEMIIQGDGS
jgi:hypothetical protein